MDFGTLLAFTAGTAVGGFAAFLLNERIRRSGRRFGEPLIRRAIEVHPAGVSAVLDSLEQLAVWAEIQRPSVRKVAGVDGSVTLLFTDIEGSTELNERVGDERWLELLREHNQLIRATASQHRGFEVKSQGDGFMFAFAEASDALRCASQVQSTLARSNLGSGESPVRVRIGVHTGLAIAEQGDLFGLTVIVAARITELAKGGEVLVSDAVRQRAADDEFGFDDAGRVRLRGIKERYPIWALGCKSS